MADANETPDTIARKWFFYAFVGAVAYFSVVYAFILTQDVSQDPGWEKPTVEAPVK